MIERLSKFVTIDPRRLPVVMDWVRALVLAHASFIASQSSAKSKLLPILDLLNQRVAHHEELNQMRQITEAVLMNSSMREVVTPSNSDTPILSWTPLANE